MVPTSVPASRLYPADPPTSLRPYVVLAIVIPRHRHLLPCLDPPVPLSLPFPSAYLNPKLFSISLPAKLARPSTDSHEPSFAFEDSHRAASISLFIRHSVSSIFAWLSTFPHARTFIVGASWVTTRPNSEISSSFRAFGRTRLYILAWKDDSRLRVLWYAWPWLRYDLIGIRFAFRSRRVERQCLERRIVARLT